MAFENPVFPGDVWVLMLFQVDDNATRAAIRACSPGVQGAGEQARRYIFREVLRADIRAGVPTNTTLGSLHGFADSTVLYARLSFWTPWVGSRSVIENGRDRPMHMCSEASIRHRDYVQRNWIDRYRIYYGTYYGNWMELRSVVPLA